MKRYLLIVLTALLSLPLWAAGDNSGDSKLNAIEFDWTNGNEQDAGQKWYRVDLSPLYDDIENPTLMLYLTNLDAANSTEVTVRATLLGQTEERTYTIAPKASKTWVRGAAVLVQTDTRDVYLTLKSNHRIAISARAYETENIDEACLNATLFVVKDNARAQQAANSTIWYQVNIANLRDGGEADGQEVEAWVTNNGTATAHIEGALSLDCPASGTTDQTMHIAAGATAKRTVKRAMIDALKSNDAYIRVQTDQPLTIETHYTTPAPTDPVFVSNSSNTIEVELEHLYSLGNDAQTAPYEQIYKVLLDSVRKKNRMPEASVTNIGTAPATITAEVGFSSAPTSVLTRTIQLQAGENITGTIEKNMVEGITTEDGYVYVRVRSTQPLTFIARLKHVNEGNKCEKSVAFNWETGHTQAANTTVWYAVDITDPKTNIQDIIVRAENLSGKPATLTAEVAFACPYIDLQTFTRTIAGNTQLEKTLNYSLFGMLATDVVYVGLTTTEKVRVSATTAKPETKEPDEMCLDAIAFDKKEGHVQKAGTTVWYKVNVNDYKYSDLIPCVVIQNRGEGALTIQGEMSLDCPDALSNAVRSLTIAQGGTYEKQISRDLIDNIDQEEVYFKLTCNQEFSFQVRMDEKDPGKDCKAAIPFNWTAGHDQTANTKRWYAVDLTQAKASKSDILLTVRNKDKADGMLYASVAFTCPCDIPQTEKTYMAASQEKTKRLPFSTIEITNDTVWVLVETPLNIHFEAKLQEAAPFEPIDCPEDATAFQWRTLYQENGGADTAWYYLSKDILQDILQKTDSTPRLYLHNTAGKANTITASVAYHCPVTSEMVSKSVTIGNGETLYKMLERSFAEQIAGRDTIMVRLVATGAYEFSAELVNPYDGADCLHAQPVNIPDTLIQEANTTAWYKLDVAAVAAVAALHQKLTFGVFNLGDKNAHIDAAVYFSCDSDAVATRGFGIGAGQTRTRDFSSELFLGLQTDYLYLRMTTDQQIGLLAYANPLVPIEPVITVCEDALPVAPNTLYSQQAGEKWYVVNLTNLRDNTTGDAMLTVNNLSEQTMVATAEISWQCPVAYEMTAVTRSLNGYGIYQRTITRQTIDATGDSLLYVRVTTDQELTFQLNVTLDKGEKCEDAIEFDWVNGNVHTANQPLWYRVALSEERIPEGKDLRLWIENLDNENSTDAVAMLYFECGGQQLTNIEHTFEAGESKSSTIDRNLIKAAGWPDLMIYYNSSNPTKISVELVEHIERRDTIYLRICAGDSWIDPHSESEEPLFFYRPTSEYADLSAPLHWSDTVPMRGGSLNCDSIYTYYVTPVELPNPTLLPKDTLAKYGAVPVIKQGMEVFVDSAVVAIERYLALDDSVVLAEKPRWEGIPTGIVSKETTTLTLTMVLADSCDTEVKYPFTFEVAPYRVDSTEITESICKGSEYTTPTRPQTTYLITQDTIIRDTIAGCTVKDTLDLDRQIDSVYIYQLTVKPTYDIDTTVTICQSELPYQFGTQTLTEAGTYSETFQSVQYGCDSIVTLTLAVNPTFEETKTDTICDSELPYIFGTQTLTEAGTYIEPFQTIYGCDSVVTLTLVVNPTFEETETVTLCDSELPYQFGTQTLTEAGTYIESFQTIHGCDSVVTLTLIVNPTIEETETVTLCDSELPYQFGELSLTEAGEYTQTFQTEGECDRIVTLTLTVYDSALPDISGDDIAAVCGQAINTSAADAILQNTITAEGYAPNATAKWMRQQDSEWKALDNTAIDGQTESVTLKYVVESDCGVKESEVMTIEVETASYANTEHLATLPAVSKYSNRLLMLNLNAIQEDLGWTIAEEDVTWYRVKGQADATHPDDAENDIAVGNGFYYTTGEQLTDDYYAVVHHPSVNPADCEQYAMTVLLAGTTLVSQSPMLQPTAAHPEQSIYIVNLNPDKQTEIRVYDVEGNLYATYTSTAAEQFIMQAASQQGYYLVDVQTDDNKTTLRYIVK